MTVKVRIDQDAMKELDENHGITFEDIRKSFEKELGEDVDIKVIPLKKEEDR